MSISAALLSKVVRVVSNSILEAEHGWKRIGEVRDHRILALDCGIRVD